MTAIFHAFYIAVNEHGRDGNMPWARDRVNDRFQDIAVRDHLLLGSQWGFIPFFINRGNILNPWWVNADGTNGCS